MTIPVPYLVITNGDQTIAWEKENNSLKSLEAFPSWV
jgi:hypothetical protein